MFRWGARPQPAPIGGDDAPHAKNYVGNAFGPKDQRQCGRAKSWTRKSSSQQGVQPADSQDTPLCSGCGSRVDGGGHCPQEGGGVEFQNDPMGRSGPTPGGDTSLPN